MQDNYLWIKSHIMNKFWKVVLAAFVGTLLALMILFIVTVGSIGSLASAMKSSQPKAVEPNSILKVSGTIEEQGREEFNFNITSTDVNVSTSVSLLKAVRAIDEAAKDPDIKLLYLAPDKTSVSVAGAEELRAAINRFRASGKPVIAYSDSYSLGTYYLASVADKVVMNTYGDCMFSGMSATMMFYKDLIDKLGVDIQLIRHGKFKSAGEPYIKNTISPENREQYECLLNTIWNTMVEGIGESRDFTAEQFTEWVDNLAINGAKDALEKGIIDELWFKDELEDYVCSLCGVEEAKDLKISMISDYAAAKVKNNVRAKDKIAVIYANGEIVMGDKTGNIGDNFAREIAKVRRDSTVKAVIFRVNSPGGSVQASAIIRHEIDLLKQTKPVIASYGEYAASGGYWISCGCDKIFSDKMTLTGSIGVFGLVPSFGRAISKNLHVNTVEVSTNKHGAFINGFTPLDDEEVEWMQGMIERTYSEFTELVADGRGMSVERVDELAQGRVWSGSDAIGIGLVDEIGTLQDAIEYAVAAAGISEWQLAEYPAEKTSMERFMEILSGTESAKVNVDKGELANEVDRQVGWLLEADRPLMMARMTDMPVLSE